MLRRRKEPEKEALGLAESSSSSRDPPAACPAHCSFDGVKGLIRMLVLQGTENL